jgi:hypothetical protein
MKDKKVFETKWVLSCVEPTLEKKNFKEEWNNKHETLVLCRVEVGCRTPKMENLV